MFSLTILGLVAAYMAVLFAVAWSQERPSARARGKGLGPSVYALSLAIYCTSWTYYGAVGTAARDGWEYLPIYIGPVIGLTLLFPLWRRIAAAASAWLALNPHNIDKDIRFDAVLVAPGKIPRHIPAAFLAE